MAGLLDAISGNWTDDPNQNAAIRQGLLSGVFGAMAGRGNRMQALGQGGLLGLSGYSSTLAAQEQAARDAQAREMQALQTQNLRSQLERQQAMQGLAKQFYRPEQTMPGEMTQPEPQAAFRAAELTGTLPQSQMGAPRTIPAGFDFAGYADALAQFDPVESARLRASLQKDRTPIKVGRGEALLDPETRQPIYISPVQGDASGLGQMIAEMSALPEGHPMRAIYMQAIQKASTHAPGTSVNVGLQAPTQVIDPSTGQPILIQPTNRPGAAPQVLTDPRTGKPFGVVAKETNLTEGQAKANLFGTRMLESDKIINDLAKQGITAPSAMQQMTPGGGILGTAATAMATPEQQQVDQAQRDFINAVLRRESGAAISPSEFDNARKQYFVQPLDSQKVIAQKARNRQTAIMGMLAEVPEAKRGIARPSATPSGFQYLGKEE